MFKSTCMIVFLGACLGITAAQAQTRDSGAGGPTAMPGPSGLSNAKNLTATGATVPRPGVPQGAGTTSLDRGLYRQDNRIMQSICVNC